MLELQKGQSLPSLLCVEPALIPIQGVLPARVLTRVETITLQPSKLTSQPGCVVTGAAVNRVCVVVVTFSNEPLMIPTCIVIGVAEPVSETAVNLVNSRDQTVAKLPTVPRRKNGIETLYSKLLQGKLDDLSQEEGRFHRARIVKIRSRFSRRGNERF